MSRTQLLNFFDGVNNMMNLPETRNSLREIYLATDTVPDEVHTLIAINHTCLSPAPIFQWSIDDVWCISHPSYCDMNASVCRPSLRCSPTCGREWVSRSPLVSQPPPSTHPPHPLTSPIDSSTPISIHSHHPSQVHRRSRT